MNLVKKYFSFIILLLFAISCGTTVNVEYPVFANTKEGRQLMNFIGIRKNVGLVVEKPQLGLWSQIFSDSSFIDQMPAKIFEAMDKEGYYKLIDVTKTSANLNEAAFSLTGLTSKRLELGKQLASDMFLYIGYQKPAMTCGVENKLDKAGAALAIGAALYNAHQGKSVSANTSEVMKPTGYIDLLIPLDATLVITETGQTMKAVVTKPYREHNSVGNTNCPSPLQVYANALDNAAKEIISRMSPKVKTVKIDISVKDENPEVADLLKEGYLEIKGETPNMQRAYENWKKADNKARGKSEGALGNIGAYYFSVGDFDNAIKYFEKAMELKSGKREYYRDLRKKVEAASRVADKNEAI